MDAPSMPQDGGRLKQNYSIQQCGRQHKWSLRRKKEMLKKVSQELQGAQVKRKLKYEWLWIGLWKRPHGRKKLQY